jgi:hypothetical protein
MTQMDIRRQRPGDINAALFAFVAAPSERTGTLILRVWVEDGQPDRLRARILRLAGPDRASPIAVTSIDEVLSVVRGWLEEVLDPDA